MKLLLDTHTLYWWNSDPDQLSAAATNALQDAANEVWFSVVNIWEIAIKAQLQKFKLNMPLTQIVQVQLNNNLQILNIELDHVLGLQQLPIHHRDPFDRLLIAQAIHHQATLVTVDPLMKLYEIPTLW